MASSDRWGVPEREARVFIKVPGRGLCWGSPGQMNLPDRSTQGLSDLRVHPFADLERDQDNRGRGRLLPG